MNKFKRGPLPLSNEEFVERSLLRHGNKYQYDNLVYVSGKVKVEIECPDHGKFYQLPFSHMAGQGCPVCAGVQRKKSKFFTQDQFIEKVNKVYNNYFDYTKTVYGSCRDKITITCPKHSDFEQFAYSHLSGVGCIKCNKENRHEEFLRKKEILALENPKVFKKTGLSKETLLDRIQSTPSYTEFNYSLVSEPINTKKNIVLLCPQHGKFTMRFSNFTLGQKCKRCADDLRGKEAHNKTWPERTKGRMCTLYLLNLSSDTENLYKVGITCHSFKTRTKGIPYKCSVIGKIRSTDSQFIYDTEQTLHKQLKSFRKIPKIKFGGMYECYKPTPEIISAFNTFKSS